MPQRDLTDAEIDDAIRRSPLIKLRKLAETLGVPPEQVLERWECFRQEVYRRIAAGKSTPEIVAEVGLSTRAIAAFRANWTHGYRPEGMEEDVELGSGPEAGAGDEDTEDAVATTFGLERDLQRTLRENIGQLEPGLRIIDGGREHRCASGLIDILCADAEGALVVVELKAGVAADAALGQVLGYMGTITREMTAEGEHAGRRVRGILVVKDISGRVRHASLAVPNLRLVGYAVRFTFAERARRHGRVGSWRL